MEHKIVCQHYCTNANKFWEDLKISYGLFLLRKMPNSHYNNNIQMFNTGYFKPSIVKGLLKCLFVKIDKLVYLNYL